MRRGSRAARAGALVVAVVVAGVGSGWGRKARPSPCPAGRYGLVAELLPGVGHVEAEQGGIRIPGLCDATVPKQFKGAARGTVLRAVWRSCTGTTGRVKLRGTIRESCMRLRGTLTARRFRRSLDGTLARTMATIGAAGGRIASGDGRIVLDVPPGALAADTAFSITEAGTAGAPDATSLLSSSWEIEPGGTPFAVPATLAITLDDATPADTRAAVIVLDAASRTWVPQAGTTVIGQMAFTQIRHLSRYAAARSPSGPGCDDLYSGGPGTVIPIHTAGGLTVSPGVKTREDVVFSGPSEISLGSSWTVPGCVATITGSFGPVAGDGAWTDHTQGGGGAIAQSGATFAFTLVNRPPAAPRGPYLGLADPCHAAPAVFQYALNLEFAADCTDRCSGVTCDDGKPCTDDLCDPATGACQYLPRSGSCGSGGGGRCVEGECVVKVPMNVGQNGASVCAAQGLTCVELPAFAEPAAGCLAFHPTATVSSDLNGWRQAVYCNDNSGLACIGRSNDCHHCPACSASALDCSLVATMLFDEVFAACAP